MILPSIFMSIEKFQIDGFLEVGIGIFSILLFALSITAYRNTGIKKILFAAAAFGLFGIQVLVDSLESYLGLIPEDIADIIIPLITFVILILFFVAIIKKR